MLEVHGFEVRAFGSGAELLDGFAPVDGSCAIFDFNLPDTDGLVLHARLTAIHGHVPFIVITGRGTDEDRQRALAAGAVAYFLKPVRKEPLIAAVLDAVALIR